MDKNYGFNAHPREWNREELLDYLDTAGIYLNDDLYETEDLVRLVVQDCIKNYE